MKGDTFTDSIDNSHGPVAILGSGISGCAVQKLLVSRGKTCQLFDQRNRIFTQEDAKRSSFVVQSPGFEPNHEWIKTALSQGKEIFSEIDLGLSCSDHSEFVAITGTNGKTSLTSILGHVARRLNMPCEELGNIGRPLSEAVTNSTLKKKIVFHETSSFQAVSSRSLLPDAVLWINFAPDHIDYHGSEREYFFAKLKLANSCVSPHNVFIGTSVIKYARKFGVGLNVGFREIKPFTIQELPRNIASFHLSKPQLENLAFARSWFEHKGVGLERFFEALVDYNPHPHRLKKVKSVNGVNFWNDSKSTNELSTVAACNSFSKKVIWIGGGKSKGLQIDQFVLNLYPYIKSAFLLGETASELSKNLRNFEIESQVCQHLEDAVAQAFQSAHKNDNILFSPGFASFDMFLDYNERGNSFESLVFDLKNTIQISTNLPIYNLQASH
tara:strand:+ start:783 stop:2105 length:1323 start_codon:yes stop_codon:yes gene_type:complete